MRLDRPRSAVLALAAACLATAAGCSDDFTPRSVVEKTRILAVRASDPRLAAGESTRLTALVVAGDPVEDAALERSWEVCPFTENEDTGYACAWPPGVPDEALEFLRGTSRSFDFVYLQELVPLVDLFCEQQAELVEQLPPGITLPDCSSGFPARVRLAATNPATGEETVAVKTLYLEPSVPPEHYRDNTNPRIAGLALADATAPILVGEKTEVRCTVDETSLETFQPLDEDEEQLEELQLSWYVRNGRLDEGQTFFSTVAGDPDEAQSNEVEPEEPGPVTVWCVIRDGRGGIDWASLELVAE